MEGSRSTPLRLLVYRDSSVRVVDLDRDHLVLGRGEGCDIRLPDATVSRQHLALHVDGVTVRFRDLGGANGVLLDGRPVTEGVLAPGQTLLLGTTRLSLDTRRSQPHMQVPREPHTETLEWRFAGAGPGATSPPAASAPDAVTVLEALRPDRPCEDLVALGQVLLGAVLETTGRRRGLVARLEPYGPECVVSLDLDERGGGIELHADLVHAARHRQEAFSVASAGRGPRREQVVIPVGEGPEALFVLESPGEAAPRGQAMLRLARACAEIAWAQLSSELARAALAEELHRLRFEQGAGHALLRACRGLDGLCDRLRRAGRHGAHVWLDGEDGTEGEALARLVHAAGEHSHGPFLVFNANLLRDEDLAAELFGVPDAGASVGGALLRAHGGTLFLEDPEALPAALQERLAATVTDGRVEYAGVPEPIPLTVRLIVKASEALQDLRGAGSVAPSFADLFVVTATVPPLRARAGDIAPLTELLLAELGPAPDGAPRSVGDAARQALAAHPWPGNVRQLRRVVELAAIAAGNQPIAPRHLPQDLIQRRTAADPAVPTLAEIERDHIVHVLDLVGGSKRKAADLLGIATSTIYEKIKRHGIDR